MQHAILEWARLNGIGVFGQYGPAIRRGKQLAEADEHPQGVGLCQVAGGVSPSRHEFLRVVGRTKARTQVGRDIVIEAQKGCGKMLLQNGHARKQAHGLSLNFVGR